MKLAQKLKINTNQVNFNECNTIFEGIIKICEEASNRGHSFISVDIVKIYKPYVIGIKNRLHQEGFETTQTNDEKLTIGWDV